MEFTAQELSALPTIGSGHSANLKIDEGTRRVWLERTGIADGESYDNKVTIQQLTGDGQWETVEEYPGGDIVEQDEPQNDDRAAEIKGTITLIDGTVSQFQITRDGIWSQWGAEKDRLARSADIVDVMRDGLINEDLLTSSNDDD
jgi:hypothetical protein